MRRIAERPKGIGKSTKGCEAIRKRRLRADGSVFNREMADAWAKQQPWYPRLVKFETRSCVWWTWFVRPEKR